MSVAVAFKELATIAVPYACVAVEGAKASTGVALFTTSVAEPLLCAMLPTAPE